MTDVHSCSYYCDRPKCIKAQRDELRERLAQQAGLRNAFLHIYGKEDALCDSEIEKLRQLERFAALVAAAEREAIAKMVEGLFDDPNDSVLAFIVDAIRARGNT